jgi:hypothetical protein
LNWQITYPLKLPNPCWNWQREASRELIDFFKNKKNGQENLSSALHG